VDRNLYPDYYVLIKKPINLLSVGNKISKAAYKSLDEFHSDMNTLFSNCFTYNKKGTYGYVAGTEVQALYNKLMKTHQKSLGKVEPAIV